MGYVRDRPIHQLITIQINLNCIKCCVKKILSNLNNNMNLANITANKSPFTMISISTPC